MKKKKGNFVPRFLKKLLVLTLLFSLTAGTVSVLPVQTEVFAAAQKKTGARKFRVQLGGTRQRYYLTKKGSTWLLTDRHGKKGNWLPVYPGTKRQRAKNRYYYFNSKGCLCREKHFHKINKRIARRTFKGTYYFGETNGRLLRKAGWRTIGGKKYYLDSFGKRYEKRVLSPGRRNHCKK